MRRVTWLFVAGTAFSLTALMLILTGCGGGGGPVTPPETGPGPSPNAEFRALLPAAQKDATYVGPERCAQCHNAVHAKWQQTTHSQKSVGCEQCHGAGSVHVAAPAKTNILTFPTNGHPENVTQGIVCGQCHGPTFDQWKESEHSKKVTGALTSKSKTCYRCHSSEFRIQMIESKLTAGQTPDQVEAGINAPTVDMDTFSASTHSSAACANCHAPHERTGKLTSSGNEAQLRRATFNTSTDLIDPGSPPSEYVFYDHICAQCHNGRGANGAITKLRTDSRPNMHDSNQHNMLLGIGGAETGGGPVVRTGSHTTVPDQCVHCHMPTRRHTFTVSFDVSCQPCHTAADAAARVNATRSDVQSRLLALRTRMERWASQTFTGQNDANAKWDYSALLTEEGITPPDQTLIPDEVKRARHNYYFVVRDLSLGIHNLRYTQYLLDVANQQLDAIGVSRAATRAYSPAEGRAILQRDLQRAKQADIHHNDA